MIVKTAEFVTSVSDANKLTEYDDLPQFTFVGRSNVGKSSLINYLTNRKNLAKTSSTPGRTRLINFFKINQKFYFQLITHFLWHIFEVVFVIFG